MTAMDQQLNSGFSVGERPKFDLQEPISALMPGQVSSLNNSSYHYHLLFTIMNQAPGNGVGMKIWQCYDNLPAQTWVYNTDSQFVLSGRGKQLCHLNRDFPPMTSNIFQIYAST
jgi:hypothetical protein